jgi:cell wall-associated NlpC family hydrolase
MATSATASAVNGQGIATKAVEVGVAVAGQPYVWNGKTTSGFDCSGFVSYVLAQAMPNLAGSLAMNVAGYMDSNLFEDIAEADRKPGDIVIFPAHAGAVNHIGIVVDATHWIGSQSSTGVKQVLFTNPYWGARPRRFRRLRGISTVAMNAGRGVVAAARA